MRNQEVQVGGPHLPSLHGFASLLAHRPLNSLGVNPYVFIALVAERNKRELVDVSCGAAFFDHPLQRQTPFVQRSPPLQGDVPHIGTNNFE
eukprot:1380102-Amphidinium_carterae.1